MERIHVGKGVYRSEENTQLFEVFTDEQMELMKSGECYKYMLKHKLKGGFHGVKVLGRRNEHGTLVFENLELVSQEQAAVIKSIINKGKSPEVVYEYGYPMGVKHDHSSDSEIGIDDGLPTERSEGVNISPDNINPGTGKPYEDDDHEPLDESFIGEDDVESDTDTGNEPGTGPSDGDAVAGIEPKEQTAAGRPSGKSNKKPTSKSKSNSK